MTPFFRKLQDSDDRIDQRLSASVQSHDFDLPSQSTPVNQDIRVGEVRATFGHVDRDEQIHRLRFMRENERIHNDEEDDWESRQSPLNFIILASLLIVLVVLGWFGYRWFADSYNDTPPVFMADATPYKVRPDSPGGLVIPHQDKLIYGRITSQNQQTPERLLPLPEQPILPESDSYGHPAYGPQQGGYTPQDQSQVMPQASVMGQSGQPMYAQPMQQQTQQGQPLYAPTQQSVPQQYQGQQPMPQSGQTYPQQQYAPHGYGPQQQDLAYGQQPQYFHNQQNQVSEQPQQQYAPQQQVAVPGQSYQLRQHPVPSSNSGGAPAQQPATVPAKQEALPAGATVAVDPLDELLSSEVKAAEKSGSTKLKLASLNNDSPYSSRANNKKGEAKESTKGVVSDVNYRVQLGSFPNEKEAKSEIRRLKSLDNSIFSGKKFIIQKSASSVTGNVVYKVMVGFFPTVNTATTFKNKMKIHRVNGIVVKSAA